MKKQMTRPQKRKPASRSAAQNLTLLLAGSFGAGAAAAFLLLCVFALAMLRMPVPAALVKPFACVAAAAGSAASGLVLARGLGRQKMACGLACGVFYSLCLLTATVLTGRTLDWSTAGMTVPLSLLLGGLMGGAAAALRSA